MLAIQVLLTLCSFYALLLIGFRLLDWASTEPPEVHPVPGLCHCNVDPMAGIYGHCDHKRVAPEYHPRHAAPETSARQGLEIFNARGLHQLRVRSA